MILDSQGHELYELADLELLWGEPFARHVWDLIVVGRHSDLGVSLRTHDIIDLPTEETNGYDSLVPAKSWPDILSIAARIADKEGVQ